MKKVLKVASISIAIIIVGFILTTLYVSASSTSKNYEKYNSVRPPDKDESYLTSKINLKEAYEIALPNADIALMDSPLPIYIDGRTSEKWFTSFYNGDFNLRSTLAGQIAYMKRVLDQAPEEARQDGITKEKLESKIEEFNKEYEKQTHLNLLLDENYETLIFDNIAYNKEYNEILVLFEYYNCNGSRLFTAGNLRLYNKKTGKYISSNRSSEISTNEEKGGLLRGLSYSVFPGVKPSELGDYVLEYRTTLAKNNFVKVPKLKNFNLLAN